MKVTENNHKGNVLAIHAEKIAEAEHALRVAMEACRLDKEARKGLILRRIGDFISTTPAERLLSKAELDLAQLKREGHDIATLWISCCALASLQKDRQVLLQRNLNVKRLAQLQARHALVQKWLTQARTAYSELQSAASECKDAADVELLDFVSSNKSIAALSSVESSQAARAIKRAKDALEILADSLPKRAVETSFESPAETLDLVFDFVIDPQFDFLSFYNMTRLEDAAKEAKRIMRVISPLLSQLDGLFAEAAATMEAELNTLRELERPYLEAAASLVPLTMAVEVPILIQGPQC